VGELEVVLCERQKTHGSFAANAEYSQHLKALFRSSPSWAGMSDVQKEGFEMIALNVKSRG
jgi:hypothetical protein